MKGRKGDKTHQRQVTDGLIVFVYHHRNETLAVLFLIGSRIHEIELIVHADSKRSDITDAEWLSVA